MKIIRRVAWAAVVCTYFLALLPGLGTHIAEAYRYAAFGVAGGLVVALALCALIWGRQDRQVLFPALAAPLVLMLQVAVDSLSALLHLPPEFVTLRLGMALIILAALITAAIMAGRAAPSREHPEKTRKFARLALTTALLVYILTLLGPYVAGGGAAPPVVVDARQANADMLHRLFSIFVGLVLIWTIYAAWRRRRVAPDQAALAVVAGLLFVAQSALGALLPDLGGSTLTVILIQGLHLALAGAVWGLLVMLSALASRQVRVAPEGEELARLEAELQREKEAIGPIRQTIAGYINLTKPHVTVLLLGTTVATMAIAYRGLPPLGLVLAVLVGGALAAGSANCINCYYDRDIDQIMGRTQRRSIPAGKVPPTQALIFGLVMGALSFVIFVLFVNLISALLALGAILFYVVIYTMWLKRTTAQNIVIGGAAGAVPVLIGWTAVTGTISLPAIWLFAIIFYWTPPHFWALALLIEKDYEKAHVPMLPVLMGEQETRKQIFLYSLLLLAVTLILFAMHAMSYLYLVAALVLGGILVYMSVRLLWDRQSRRWARTLFWYSNCYLAAIFAAMVLDRVILH